MDLVQENAKLKAQVKLLRGQCEDVPEMLLALADTIVSDTVRDGTPAAINAAHKMRELIGTKVMLVQMALWLTSEEDNDGNA